MASNNLLRLLPSIDVLLKTGTAGSLQSVVGLEHLSDLARKVTDELRQEIMTTPASPKDATPNQELSRAGFLADAERRLV